MSQLSLNSISLLREQLRSIKEDSLCDRMQLAEDFKHIEQTWNQFRTATENSERELINRLTVDHELELNDMRKVMLAKDDEIDVLKCDNKALQARIQSNETQAQEAHANAEEEIRALKARLGELDKQMNESEIDKDKAVNMIKDKLIREHKTEIESLRCRFKLMTTTERSPSDTSLEKIDRPDVLDCDRNRSIILASSPKSPGSGQGLLKRILDEKERQMDLLNNQIDVLRNENAKLKDSIQSLTDTDQNQTENAFDKLKDQVDVLQKEKLRLRQKLSVERSRRQSESAVIENRYVTTNL